MANKRNSNGKKYASSQGSVNGTVESKKVETITRSRAMAFLVFFEKSSFPVTPIKNPITRATLESVTIVRTNLSTISGGKIVLNPSNAHAKTAIITVISTYGASSPGKPRVPPYRSKRLFTLLVLRTGVRFPSPPSPRISSIIRHLFPTISKKHHLGQLHSITKILFEIIIVPCDDAHAHSSSPFEIPKFSSRLYTFPIKLNCPTGLAFG
mmetsp:Transcript_6202/g.9771  ORF Transcript_6202/g.9771 Transcript_6202/m.9771 type:complete len:210 (+) Transcript_6202:3138-3767(+)